MKINPFNKTKETISDEAYAKGKKDTEDKLKVEFEDLKQDIINEYERQLNEKNMTIMLKDTELKNWKNEHLLSKQRLNDAKAKEAENERESYRIEKFKEEILKKIEIIMSDQTEIFKPILKMIGYKQEEEK